MQFGSNPECSRQLTPVNAGFFLLGRTSAQPTSAVSQNESESRFAERFAESAANPQLRRALFDRKKRRVRGLWLHQGDPLRETVLVGFMVTGVGVAARGGGLSLNHTQ